MRRLRVAHVMPWRAIGGTEWATLRMARGTAELGVENVVLFRSDAPKVGEFFAEAGFAVEPYDAAPFDAGPLSHAAAAMRFASRLRKLGIDLVHGADLSAGYVVSIASWLARKPIVCHVRNPYPWLTRFERAWTMAFAKRMVFVSADAQRSFGRTSKGGQAIANQKGVVVYDGMKLPPVPHPHSLADRVRAVKHEFGWPVDALIVGMVARLALQKDHLTLVEAAAQVVQRCPQARFLLLGGCGPEKQELAHGERVKAAIAASSARDNIVYAGFSNDVPRYAEAFDVAVLCTHFEGLPLVVLEAMSLAKPVVATAVGGIAEAVLDGQTGLLHQEGDAHQLAEQLLRVLTDRELSQRLGEEGRRRVGSEFSPLRTAQDIVDVYERSLGRSHS